MTRGNYFGRLTLLTWDTCTSIDMKLIMKSNTNEALPQTELDTKAINADLALLPDSPDEKLR